jgi:hypothetical protein
MAVHTYDAKKVKVIVGGIPLSGYADGTFIKIERDNDLFTKVVGADGITSRSKSNDRGGTAVLTLKQTSPSNDILSAFHLTDELTNAGIFPLLVQDMSGRSTFISATAWIKKLPSSEFGKDLGNREWTFDLVDVDIFVGGN